MSKRLTPFLVNRQMLDETSTLFYNDNVFKFLSGYVRSGEDPFGFNLDRMKRCLLSISGGFRARYEESEIVLKWFISEFVNALKPKHSMRYLLIPTQAKYLHLFQPFETLHGIHLVQVDTTLIRFGRSFLPPRYGRVVLNRSRNYEQLLERLMMSDGTQGAEIYQSLSENYIEHPAISVHSASEKFEGAKANGGWASTFGQPPHHSLYEFLNL